jgi:hypothetical protein
LPDKDAAVASLGEASSSLSLVVSSLVHVVTSRSLREEQALADNLNQEENCLL